MSFQWDENPHLFGGMVLANGNTQLYLKTYGYYPPLYDSLTSHFFNIFGANAVTGRLTAVTFSLLSIWVLFEFANLTYGPKTALISSILLGTMPGFFWLSRIAMLETMLIFFFSLALMLFFSWIKFNKNKMLIFSGLALGVGFLAKYQVLVAVIAMIVAILVLCRNEIQSRFKRFPVLLIVALLVVIPWFVILLQTYGLNKFGELLYVVRVGGEDRPLYSSRFFAPIFYLVDMTWPFNDIPVHPVSIIIFIFGMLGLGLWAYRRKPEDKFFLMWFLIVYVFFTLLPNKQWRYVTPLFPVLALSAASFVMFAYDKVKNAWEPNRLSLNRSKIKKFSAVLFIVFITSAVVYSSFDVYQMTARDEIHIPIEEATDYAVAHMNRNDTIMIICPFNLFSQDSVQFYLWAQDKRNLVYQYPELPVDSYKPNFNVSELVRLCELGEVKYVFLYEFGLYSPFFNTTLTRNDVTSLLYYSGRFDWTNVTEIGNANLPTIFVMEFLPANQTVS